jgi:hypothetical protein
VIKALDGEGERLTASCENDSLATEVVERANVPEL